ncbi:hypothetical protein NKI12_14350 [Mesorhizobium australicum]|uniref:Uncharacterized protein n=1 Tax=Mesorhizobium australicum TaxID=536018 RepID=A0ACC6T071_9HYPH
MAFKELVGHEHSFVDNVIHVNSSQGERLAGWVTKLRRELNTAAVCRRYAISDGTLERWLLSRARGFPQPSLRGRRRFWLESDLDAFDAAVAGSCVPAVV